MRRSKHLTIVIKIGTSSIVDEVTHQPILSILSLIVETALRLRGDGHRVVLVSSGAIGVGLKRMDIAKKPKHLPQVQALAAVGQCRLMSLWDSLFAHVDQPVAQILLTRNDIADRTQYLNAQNTLAELLTMGVIPIVNENDTLAVSEIKFGDNDTLSAITAAMIHADYLFLMTDVDCLYDRNPRKFSDAKPIEIVQDIDALQVDVSSAGSNLGTGGMATKVVAARLATSAGTTTIVTRSSKPNNVSEIIRYLHPLNPPLANGETTTSTAATSPPSTPHPPLHTRFLPTLTPLRNRAFWILHGLSPHGTLFIDRGALSALQSKAGLLPVGILAVSGSFAQQEAVRLVVVDRSSIHNTTSTPQSPSTNSHIDLDSPPIYTHSRQLSAATADLQGVSVGRAVSNYSAAEVLRIKGLQSAEIEAVLGYADSEYVCLRENVSLFDSWAAGRGGKEGSRPSTPAVGVTPRGGRTPAGQRTPERGVEGGRGVDVAKREDGEVASEVHAGEAGEEGTTFKFSSLANFV